MSKCILEFKKSIRLLVERTIVKFRVYQYTIRLCRLVQFLMGELRKTTCIAYVSTHNVFDLNKQMYSQ